MVDLPRHLPTPDHSDYEPSPDGTRSLLKEASKSYRSFSFKCTVPNYFGDTFGAFVEHLLNTESVFANPQTAKPSDLEGLDFSQLARTHEILELAMHGQKHHAEFSKAVAALADYVREEFASIDKCLPREQGYTPFLVPIYQLLPDAPATADNLMAVFLEEPYLTSGICNRLGATLRDNLARLAPGRQYDPDLHRSVSAKSLNLPIEKVLRGFFADTPLLDIFMHKVPVAWEYPERFRHTHVIADSGAGKTTLLKKLIMRDVMCHIPKDPPSIVVVDPHSVLTRWLSEVDLPLETERRIILIDPRDIDYPPAMNPLAINRKRFAAYTPAEQEQVTRGVLQTLNYLFGSLGLEMTGKQQVFFNYLATLLLAFPKGLNRNATLKDMVRVLSDAEYARPAIAALDETPRDFLERELFGGREKSEYRETKEQIRVRIEGLLSDTMMERFFCAPENKIDLFTELNRGAIILIDTADDFLKDRSPLFGRMMIAMVFQALQERAPIPEAERYPTFLYVDEAHNYFGAQTPKLLTDCRKLACGCVFAHHYLDQTHEAPELKSALMTLTAIKFAANLRGDLSTMAAAMRTTPDFIEKLPQYTFAGYISGITPHAVQMVPMVPMPKERSKSRERMDEFTVLNRHRISLGRASDTALRPSSPQFDDEERSPR